MLASCLNSALRQRRVLRAGTTSLAHQVHALASRSTPHLPYLSPSRALAALSRSASTSTPSTPSSSSSPTPTESNSTRRRRARRRQRHLRSSPSTSTSHTSAPSASPSRTDDATHQPDFDLVNDLIYQGPLVGGVRRIKYFSLGSCALTLAGTPVLVFLGSGDAGVGVLQRAALGSVVLSFGVATTLLLSWFVKPYVTRMWHNDAHEHVLGIETLSLLGRRVQHYVDVRDLMVDDTRPFATFKDFQSGASFFVHSEVVAEAPKLRGMIEHLIDFSYEKQGQDEDGASDAGKADK